MITDEQIQDNYLRYYERGILKKEVRSYEVSIWTLQDEFITVLKWSNVEHKGRIQNPKLTLSDDGLQEFSFSIPMYYDQGNGYLEENPLWYNTRNGNLMINLRKIKVIFNKQTADEEIFELVITKTTETHEGDVLTCTVNCEGLAFHELGKIGYKYALSLDDFELDYQSWQEKGYWYLYDEKRYDEPMQTVQYWCGKINLEQWPSQYNFDINDIQANKWYYEINMNWASFFDNFNGTARSSHAVYEEMHTSAWQIEDDKIVPKKLEDARIKERSINISESNIYNITQEIAKQFGIFCRYEYGHDANYHIIYRKVVFFNNFIHDNNIMGFTYPYSSKKNIRELDGTDIVTKLYVRSVNDSSVLLGEDSIMYCNSNKTMEDYIFNFDYLHETGGITEDQYEAIQKYEVDIRRINETLVPLADTIAAYEREKVDLEAKLTVYTNSLALDKEQYDANTALKNELIANYSNGELGNTYIDVYTANNPDYAAIIQGQDGIYYVNLDTHKKGIKVETLEVYRTWGYNSSTQTYELSNRVTNFSFIYDEFGNPAKLVGITPGANSNTTVYLTYEYEPRLYFDAIAKTWDTKRANDQRAVDEITAILYGSPEETYTSEEEKEANSNGLVYLLKRAKNSSESLNLQKKKIIQKFNDMMGPALREGFWQPEDYQDYGEPHSGAETFSYNYENNNDFASINTGDGFMIGWDNRLFDEEQDIYYEEGTLQNKIFYPCINISGCYGQIASWLNDGKQLSVFFNNTSYYTYMTATEWSELTNKHEGDYYVLENGYIIHYRCDASGNSTVITTNNIDFSSLRTFTIGSEALLGFVRVKNSDTIVPVLILTGTKSMSDRELDYMIRYGNMSIGCIVTDQTGAASLDGSCISIGNLTDDTLSTNPFWTIDTFNEIKIIEDNLYAVKDIVSDVNANHTQDNQLEIVYPRVKFSSLMLKTTSGLYLNYNNILLEEYKDYYILSRIVPLRNYAPEYLVTIKPESFVKYSFTENNTIAYELMVSYVLSNASTAIYLDALDIAKENAYPKVSYTIEPNVLNENIISTLYQKLNWLVMINDTQLKFRNVFGYISKLVLDLDAPQNDSIEIKNYKNKFEDIFSTIVASTESIQKNDNILGSLSRGTYSLSPSGLQKTLIKNESTVINYLADNFLNSAEMHSYLSDIFEDAAGILSNSNDILNQSTTLSADNAAILSGFSQTVQSTMVPKIFRQQVQPVEFKQGDIWLELDSSGNEIARHVATSNSSNAKPGYGWTKTYGGSYAQIQGAGINMDADTGLLDLFGDDVNIIGNNSVNIGGVEVNIGTVGSAAEGNERFGGINLIATGYNENNFEQAKMSRVLIHPTEMEVAGSKITILTNAQNNATNAVKLDGNGIWVGSNKQIILTSSNALDGSTDVKLTPGELLLGASRDSTSTAIKITPDAFVVAAGAAAANSLNSTETGVTSNEITGIRTSLTGLKITKDYFGMAMSDNNTLNSIIMNQYGITLGSDVTGVNSIGQANLNDASSGAYVRIGGNGIVLNTNASILLKAGQDTQLAMTGSSFLISGVNTIFTVNTQNVVINSSATADNSIFELKKANANNGYDTALKYSLQNGLTITGNITATTISASNGTIGGWTIGNGLSRSSGGSTVSLHFHHTDENYDYAINAGNNFWVDYNGNVWLNKLMIYDPPPHQIEGTHTSGNYIAIDFSKLNFKAAISLSSQWSGNNNNTITVTSTANLWGRFSNTLTDTATIAITQAEMTLHNGGGIGTGSVGGNINGKGFALTNVTISAQKAFNAGGTLTTKDFWRNGTMIYVDVRSASGDIYQDSMYIGGNTCLAKGTKITLSDGTLIPIEKLQLGMKVLAYDETEQSYKPSEICVVQVLKDRPKEIIDIYLSSGKKITATTSHPILTLRGWCAGSTIAAKAEYKKLNIIDDIKEGDILVSPEKSDITIERIIRRKDLDDIPVYNIDVELYNTYLAEGIVVHNTEVGAK